MQKVRAGLLVCDVEAIVRHARSRHLEPFAIDDLSAASTLPLPNSHRRATVTRRHRIQVEAQATLKPQQPQRAAFLRSANEPQSGLSRSSPIAVGR